MLDFICIGFAVRTGKQAENSKWKIILKLEIRTIVLFLDAPTFVAKKATETCNFGANGKKLEVGNVMHFRILSKCSVVTLWASTRHVVPKCYSWECRDSVTNRRRVGIRVGGITADISQCWLFQILSLFMKVGSQRRCQVFKLYLLDRFMSLIPYWAQFAKWDI